MFLFLAGGGKWKPEISLCMARQSVSSFIVHPENGRDVMEGKIARKTEKDARWLISYCFHSLSNYIF